MQHLTSRVISKNWREDGPSDLEVRTAGEVVVSDSTEACLKQSPQKVIRLEFLSIVRTRISVCRSDVDHHEQLSE